MSFEEKILAVKKELIKHQIDGWLFYDFRKSNDLAWDFLEIPKDTHATRRFFYWIPSVGDPYKIRSYVEDCLPVHLIGQTLLYRSWQELEASIGKLIKKTDRIAMEYSPRCSIPYVSKVDAGTIELVRAYVMKLLVLLTYCNYLPVCWMMIR